MREGGWNGCNSMREGERVHVRVVHVGGTWEEWSVSEVGWDVRIVREGGWVGFNNCG